MFLEKIKFLNELNIASIVIKLVLALLLGGLLGIEREQKQRPAGLKTYVLVCLGSTLVCITNLYIMNMFGNTDPARIPAQVVSGIGFLGAGTIIVTRKHQVKGLTTAAGLWCCAAIGISVGFGFYSGAIVCTLLIFLSLRLMSFVDKKMSGKRLLINIYAEYDSSIFIRELIKYAKANGYKLSDMESLESKIDEIKSVSFSLKIKEIAKKPSILKEIEGLNGCVIIETID